MPLYVKNENLEEYPKIDNRYLEMPTADALVHLLSIGDLHGSALKSLYFLTKYNLININEGQYLEFVAIYKRLHALWKNKPEYSDEQIQQDLIQLNDILFSIKVNPVAQNLIDVLYIGDDFADRAGLDLANLVKYEILHNLNFHFRSIHSNHTATFLAIWAEDFPYKDTGLPFRTQLMLSEDPKNQGFGQDLSLQNLGILLRKNLVRKDSVNELVLTFLSHYQLFSFSLSADYNHFSFFTHAPADLRIIGYAIDRMLQAIEKHPEQLQDKIPQEQINSLCSLKTLAQCFEMLFDFVGKNFNNSVRVTELGRAFAYAITEINKVFYYFVSSKSLALLNDRFTNEFSIDAKNNPVQFLAWNRTYQNLFRPVNFLGCNLHYVHGHTAAPSEEHITNLDNALHNAIGRTIAVTGEFKHEGSFPHLHLSDQLSREQVQQYIANFDVNSFIEQAKKVIQIAMEPTEEEVDKTIELDPVSEQDLNDEEGISSAAKRSASELNNPAKRQQLTDLFKEPRPILQRSFSAGSNDKKKLAFPN